MKRYSWSTPNRYSVDAQVFGEWIESLPNKKPETIVAAAKNRRSVAHALFEWDPGKAAHQYRLLQARVLYGSLTVDVVIHRRSKEETIAVKAVHRSSRLGDYDSLDDAFTEPAKRDYILSQALAQLHVFKRRYSALSELAVVFAALDQVSVPKRNRKRA